jgi:outer membrane lipoprotein-sorting protein
MKILFVLIILSIILLCKSNEVSEIQMDEISTIIEEVLTQNSTEFLQIPKVGTKLKVSIQKVNLFKNPCEKESLDTLSFDEVVISNGEEQISCNEKVKKKLKEVVVCFKKWKEWLDFLQ